MKRFEINNNMTIDSKVEPDELSAIVDNSNKTFYFIVNSIANVEPFVERLNELHEENEQLKRELQRIYDMLSDEVNDAIWAYYTGKE